jgi:hypothetical protein
MPTWTNADGLFVKFGPSEGTVGTTYGFAGEYSSLNDGMHVVKVTINPMTALTTTGTIVSDSVVIPNGARIEEVTTIAETAATSGGAATLDIGLIDQDRTTAFDDDGLIAAAAITSHDAAGETVVYRAGVAGAGALVGTTLTNTGLIVVSYNTAAYTAGKLIVLIKYYIP